MVDLRRAVYSQDFKYKNVDGSESSITILPLKGSYIPVLFDVANRLQGLKEIPEESSSDFMKRLFESLDAKTISNIHEMSVVTITRSIPGANPEDIQDFVSQHMFELLPVIISVNICKIK